MVRCGLWGQLTLLAAVRLPAFAADAGRLVDAATDHAEVFSSVEHTPYGGVIGGVQVASDAGAVEAPDGSAESTGESREGGQLPNPGCVGGCLRILRHAALPVAQRTRRVIRREIERASPGGDGIRRGQSGRSHGG